MAFYKIMQPPGLAKFLERAIVRLQAVKMMIVSCYRSLAPRNPSSAGFILFCCIFFLILSSADSMAADQSMNSIQKESDDYNDSLFTFAGSGNEAVFVAEITRGKTLYVKNEILIFHTRIPFGSLIKPFTLYYALSSGAIDLKKVYYCRPSSITDPPSSRCWYTPGHGRLNCVQALTHSCNSAFMKIASNINYHKFLEFLELFGFDTDSIANIKNPIEQQMIMTGLKDKLLVSPASLALKVAGLLEGTLYRFDGEMNLEIERFIPVNKKTVDIVRGAMTMSMVEGHSVPKPEEHFIPLNIICKTGTIGRFNQLDSGCKIPKNNGLFVALCINQDKKYLVAVVVPCGIGDDAARVGREIIHKLTSSNPGR
jgi:cell division protein FtsI/penicillin-binding protein 2